MRGRLLTRLFWIVAWLGLSWLIGRLTRGMRAQARPMPVRNEGTMVRDRVCNTFLPRARALTTWVGSEEHFFCSESCRRQFLTTGDTLSP